MGETWEWDHRLQRHHRVHLWKQEVRKNGGSDKAQRCGCKVRFLIHEKVVRISFETGFHGYDDFLFCHYGWRSGHHIVHGVFLSLTSTLLWGVFLAYVNKLWTFQWSFRHQILPEIGHCLTISNIFQEHKERSNFQNVHRTFQIHCHHEVSFFLAHRKCP